MQISSKSRREVKYQLGVIEDRLEGNISRNSQQYFRVSFCLSADRLAEGRLWSYHIV